MITLIVDSPLSKLESTQYPVSPFVYLSLEAQTAPSGRILLSSQLATDVEIDHVTRKLICEIEKLGHAAKKELRRLRSMQLNRNNGVEIG